MAMPAPLTNTVRKAIPAYLDVYWARFHPLYPIVHRGSFEAAAGMLAGLCARAVGGGGQYVTTSLLGAGLLLHSGVFERDGEVVPVDLSGHPFGAGPHACPGQEQAIAIASAMVNLLWPKAFFFRY